MIGEEDDCAQSISVISPEASAETVSAASTCLEEGAGASDSCSRDSDAGSSWFVSMASGTECPTVIGKESG